MLASALGTLGGFQHQLESAFPGTSCKPGKIIPM